MAIQNNLLYIHPNRRSQPPLRNGNEVGDSIIRVGVAGRCAVIVNAEEKGSAVGIGKCGHIFGNEVSGCPAVKDFLAARLQIPEGLEFDKLPLSLADETFQFCCGKEFFHAIPSTPAISSSVRS